MEAVRRLEDGVQKPVLLGRNSKRRFRVDSGAKRTDTVTQERCRGKARAQPSKIVCNRRCNVAPRAVTERRCRGGTERQPKRRGGVVEEAEWNCRAQSIDPKNRSGR